MLEYGSFLGQSIDRKTGKGAGNFSGGSVSVLKILEKNDKLLHCVGSTTDAQSIKILEYGAGFEEEMFQVEMPKAYIEFYELHLSNSKPHEHRATFSGPAINVAGIEFKK